MGRQTHEQDDFALVRWLMQQRPSPEVWGRLCAALEQVRDPGERERISAYLSGHLARWPDALRVAPQSWLDEALHGRAHPWWRIVRAVALYGATNATIQALFRTVDMQAITSLTIAGDGNRSKSGLVKALTRLGPLQLRRLELSRGMFGVKTAEVLASATNLDALEEIALHHAGFDEDALRVLASADALPPLRRFTRHARIAPDLFEELMQAPLFRALESLSIEERVQPEVLELLAGAPCASSLRALRLSIDRHRIGHADEGFIARWFEAFASSPVMDGLESLHLSARRHFRGAALRALLHSAAPRTLESLTLHINPDAEDIRALCATPMPALRHLTMQYASLRAEHEGAFAPLASNPCMETLEALTWQTDHVSEEDIVSVLSASRSLRVLRIGAHYDGMGALTDAGLARALDAGDFTRLTTLDLTRHRLTGEGLAWLANASALSTLSLDGNPITDAGLAALAEGAGLWLRVLRLKGRRARGGGAALWPLSVAGATSFAARAWPELVELDLSARGLDDEAVQVLMSASARFPALETLTLQRSTLSREVCFALREVSTDEAFPALRSLTLT